MCAHQAQQADNDGSGQRVDVRVFARVVSGLDAASNDALHRQQLMRHDEVSAEVAAKHRENTAAAVLVSPLLHVGRELGAITQ